VRRSSYLVQFRRTRVHQRLALVEREQVPRGLVEARRDDGGLTAQHFQHLHRGRPILEVERRGGVLTHDIRQAQ